MKIITLITQIFALALLHSCTKYQRLPASEKKSRINIIFDIDYTIVAPSTSNLDTKTVTVEGETYRINDGTLEIIENLASRDNVDIFFFSGGQESRNKELLKKIKTASNKSLLDYSAGLYSFNDLRQVKTEGRFSERYKKDLSVLDLDLRNTILIDDNEQFAMPDQRQNMLWIGKTYHHVEDYNKIESLMALDHLKPDYFPPTPDAWYIARNKLKYIDALLNSALDSEIEEEGTFLRFINAKKYQYIPFDEIRKSEVVLPLLSRHSPGCTSLVLSFP